MQLRLKYQSESRIALHLYVATKVESHAQNQNISKNIYSETTEYITKLNNTEW